MKRLHRSAQLFSLLTIIFLVFLLVSPVVFAASRRGIVKKSLDENSLLEELKKQQTLKDTSKEDSNYDQTTFKTRRGIVKKSLDGNSPLEKLKKQQQALKYTTKQDSNTDQDISKKEDQSDSTSDTTGSSDDSSTGSQSRGYSHDTTDPYANIDVIFPIDGETYYTDDNINYITVIGADGDEIVSYEVVLNDHTVLQSLDKDGLQTAGFISTATDTENSQTYYVLTAQTAFDISTLGLGQHKINVQMKDINGFETFDVAYFTLESSIPIVDTDIADSTVPDISTIIVTDSSGNVIGNKQSTTESSLTVAVSATDNSGLSAWELTIREPDQLFGFKKNVGPKTCKDKNGNSGRPCTINIFKYVPDAQSKGQIVKFFELQGSHYVDEGTVIDLDGDGIDEVVRGTTRTGVDDYGGINTLKMNNAFTAMGYDNGNSISFSTKTNWRGIAAGQLDSDPEPEIVAIRNSVGNNDCDGKCELFIFDVQNGKLVETYKQSITGHADELTLADLTGDGIDEVIFGTHRTGKKAHGYIEVLQLQNGVFVNIHKTEHGKASDWRGFTTGNFDNDPEFEIVALRNDVGSANVFLMDWDKTNNKLYWGPRTFKQSKFWQDITAIDIDHDGIDEIAIPITGSGQDYSGDIEIYKFTNNGNDLIWHANIRLPNELKWTALLTGNFKQIQRFSGVFSGNPKSVSNHVLKSINLPEGGDYIIEVTVMDISGKKSITRYKNGKPVKDRVVIHRSEPPKITKITIPKKHHYTPITQGSITATIEANDDQWVTRIESSVTNPDGTVQPIHENYPIDSRKQAISKQISIKLGQLGIYSHTITVTDDEGQTVTRSGEFTVYPQPYAAMRTLQEGDQFEADKILHVGVDMYDDNAVKTIQLYLNNQKQQNGYYQFTDPIDAPQSGGLGLSLSSDEPLSNGQYTAKVEVTDFSNNAFMTPEISFTVGSGQTVYPNDASKPVISNVRTESYVSTTTPDTVVENSELIIKTDVVDNQGVDTVEIYFDDSTQLEVMDLITDTDPTYDSATDSLTDTYVYKNADTSEIGDVTFTVVAEDINKLLATPVTHTYTVIADTENPVFVQFLTPSLTVQGQEATLAAEVTDNSESVEVTFEIEGVEYSGEFSKGIMDPQSGQPLPDLYIARVDTINLAHGPHQVKVTAEDPFGNNIEDTTQTLEIDDQTAPTFGNLQAFPNPIDVDTTIMVNVDIDDPSRIDDTTVKLIVDYTVTGTDYHLELDPTGIIGNVYEWNNAPTEAETEVRMYVEADDTSPNTNIGQSATHKYTVLIGGDTTAPVISDVTVTPSLVKKGDNVEFSIDATDDWNINNVAFIVDNTKYTGTLSTGNTYTNNEFNTEKSRLGLFDVYAEVDDQGGNGVVSTTTSFEVFEQVINTIITTDTSLTFTAEATTNSEIEVTTTSVLTLGELKIEEYATNQELVAATEANGFGEVPLSVYLDITPNTALETTLESAVIRIFYTDTQLTALNIDENTLKIYYFNDQSSDPAQHVWEVLTDSSVDTTNKYIWANVDHFSTYAAGGGLQADTERPIISNARAESSLTATTADTVLQNAELVIKADVVDDRGVDAVVIYFNDQSYNLKLMNLITDTDPAYNSATDNLLETYVYKQADTTQLGDIDYTINAIDINELLSLPVTKTYTVIADTEDPVIGTITVPTGPVNQGTDADVSAIVTDNSGSIKEVLFEVGTESVTATLSLTTADLYEATIVTTTIPEGANTLTVKAEDNEGNQGSDTATLDIIDQGGPSITDITVDPQLVTINDPITISATITDISGVDTSSVVLIIDADTANPIPHDSVGIDTYTWTSAPTNVVGPHTFEIQAADQSSTPVTSSYTTGTYEVNEPPIISNLVISSFISGTTPDTTYNGAPITIQVDVTDLSTIQDVSISFGTDPTEYSLTLTTGNTYEYTAADTTQTGSFDFVLHAIDAGGLSANTIAGTYNVIDDTVIPVISNVNVPTSPTVQGTSILVDATVTDNSGSLVEVLFEVGGLSVTGTLSTTVVDLFEATIDTTTLGDGQQTLIVSTKDGADNLATPQIANFDILDQSTPTISDVIVSPKPVGQNLVLTIDATISDPSTVDTTTVLIIVDGDTANPIPYDSVNGEVYTWTSTPTDTITAHTFEISADDLAATPNSGTYTQGAYVVSTAPDTLAPVLTNAIANPTAIEKGNTLTLSVDVTDDYIIETVTFNVDGVDYPYDTENAGTYSITVTPTDTVRFYTFTATATDEAGNTAQLAGTYNVIETVVETVTTTSLDLTFEAGATDNSELDITTTAAASGSVTVVEQEGNPEAISADKSNGFAEAELGIYLDITPDQTITDSLDTATIRMYYTDAEITALNLNENTLRIYHFNTNTNLWEKEADSGVDTTNNFVWAIVDHFSTFGAGGDLLPVINNNNNGGRTGAHGSGGGSSGSFQNFGGGGGGSTSDTQLEPEPDEPTPEFVYNVGISTDGEIDVKAGKTTETMINLENKGNVRDAYDVNLDGADWASLSTRGASLNPGETKDVALQLSPPSDLPDGEYVIFVEAKSKNNQNSKDTGTIRVTVEGGEVIIVETEGTLFSGITGFVTLALSKNSSRLIIAGLLVALTIYILYPKKKQKIGFGKTRMSKEEEEIVRGASKFSGVSSLVASAFEPQKEQINNQNTVESVYVPNPPQYTPVNNTQNQQYATQPASQAHQNIKTEDLVHCVNTLEKITRELRF